MQGRSEALSHSEEVSLWTLVGTMSGSGQGPKKVVSAGPASSIYWQ